MTDKAGVAIFISIIALAAFVVFSISSDGNEDRYIPDKNEWARLVIRNDIMDLTDLWRTRWAVNVIIFDEDKEIGILITPANGEDVVTDPDRVKESIRPQVDASVGQFDWLEDYKIILQVL